MNGSILTAWRERERERERKERKTICCVIEWINTHCLIVSIVLYALCVTEAQKERQRGGGRHDARLYSQLWSILT